MTQSNSMWGRNFRRRKLLKGAGAVGVGTGLASIGLVACGDDDDDDGTGDATTPAGSASQTQQPNSTPEPTPDGGPPSGGRLVVAINLETTTLNPFGTNVINIHNVQQMFEPLRHLKTTGAPDEPLVLEPGLAESYEQADSLNIVYKLREGVQFQDGTDFDADAVITHFDRINNPDSPFYSEVGQPFMGFLYGLIDSVDAMDSHTVALKLKDPFYDFHTLSAVPANGIVSPAALEQYGEDEFFTHPAGTGAFRIKQFEPGSETILERSPGYWGGDSYLDEVVFTLRGDTNSRLAAVVSGEVDWSFQLTADQIKELEGVEGVRAITKGSGLIQRTAWNCAEGPTANPMVRQAVNHAISQEDIVAAYGGLDWPAHGPATPGSPAFDPNFEPYAGRDVAKARQLLSAAGYEDGFDVNLAVRLVGGSASPPEIVIMQQQLAELGINCELAALEGAAYVEYSRSNNGGVPVDAWITDGQFGWTGYYAGNRNFTTGSAPPVGTNYGFYSNSEVDRLAEKMQLSTSDEEYGATWLELNTLLSDDAAWGFLFHRFDGEGMAASVGGYTAAPSRYFDLRSFWKA